MTPWLLLALLAASEPAPDPGETGVLEVRTLPRVEVIWEGTALGLTGDDGTLLIAGIPAGDYAVTLRKQGFRETTARIVAGTGEKTVLVLRPEPVAEPPALDELIPWEARQAAAPPAADPEDTALPPAAAGTEPAAAPPSAPGGEPPEAAATREPPAVREPPRALTPAPGGWRPGWLWALAALALPAAWLAQRRRKPPADPPDERPVIEPAWVQAGAEPGPVEASILPSPMPREGAPNAADPTFLEELKRREQTLDPGEDDVIDVEFVEVQPARREP